MYFLYVDESGNSGLKDKFRKYLVLAGIAIDEKDWLTVETEVNALKTGFFGSTEVELRSYNLRRRKPPFDALDENKYNLLQATITLLFEKLPIQVLGVVVNVENLRQKDEREDPYEIAYQELLNLYSVFLADHSGRGILILDSRAGQVSRKEGSQDNRIKIIHAQAKKVEAWALGEFKLDLINRNVLGEVFFVTSAESAGIQIADLAAYAIFHRFEYSKPNYEPFRVLSKKIEGWQDGGGTLIER